MENPRFFPNCTGTSPQKVKKITVTLSNSEDSFVKRFSESMWEKESIIHVQYQQENPNLRVNRSSGNSASFISHWNGGPSGWDFPDYDGFYLSNMDAQDVIMGCKIWLWSSNCIRLCQQGLRTVTYHTLPNVSTAMVYLIININLQNSKFLLVLQHGAIIITSRWVNFSSPDV